MLVRPEVVDDRRSRRAARRYRRAVRWAFARVPFYRDQCAVAGQLLSEPEPTPLASVPQPPHTLCPFSRPWRPDREPSLWTPDLRPLARSLAMAGCRDRRPVLEVRESLLDHTRIRRGPAAAPYRVLLSATAAVASDEHRERLNREALSVVPPGGTAWLVAGPAELATVPGASDPRLRPVRRLPVAAVADGDLPDGPAVLYEPMLGYLGAVVPDCGRAHLDTPRVYARRRGQAVTFSLPYSRRPLLLDLVPPGADRVALERCPRHGTTVLAAAAPPGAAVDR